MGNLKSKNNYFNNISQVAALLAIIPVVPTVDHLSEMALEPTLGQYLAIKCCWQSRVTINL